LNVESLHLHGVEPPLWKNGPMVLWYLKWYQWR
jgi:hypothetical protein